MSGEGPGGRPGEEGAPGPAAQRRDGGGEGPAPGRGAEAPEGDGPGGGPEGTPAAGAEGAGPKADPRDFELRARPEPVTRLDRRAVAVVAGVGAAAMLGVLSLSLSPPERAETGAELQGVSISGRVRSEAVDRLPKRYSEIEPAPPELGPPLPGDFADAILEQGRGLGVELPPGATGGAAPYRPDPLLEEEMAERVRAAKLAEQALQSEIFFPAVAGRQGAPGGADGDVERREPARRPPAAPAGAGTGAGAEGPGPQERKEAFLDRPAGRDTLNPHAVEDPLSPWQLMAGTVLRASLVTGVNSDLPGFVIAQITEDVRDSVTGTVVLVPKGARLMGRYDSFVAFGQERILLAWHRIVMPDGSSIVVDNLPATDTAGRAGLAGEVDNHIWELVQGVALSTLLGVGTELSLDDEGDVTRAVRRSLQGNVSDAASETVRRGLDIQPTLTAHPGWPLAVIVHRDLLLRPWKGAGAEG